MDLQAKLILKLPFQSGTSKSGKEWKKAACVVETLGQYPKKVCIQSFGKSEELESLPLGATATFSVDPESREFNGRWYTDVNVFAISNVTLDTPQTGYAQPAQAAPAQTYTDAPQYGQQQMSPAQQAQMLYGQQPPMPQQPIPNDEGLPF